MIPVITRPESFDQDESLRTISRSVKFIAIVVGIFAALALIGMVIGVVEVIHLVSVLSSPAI
jgi:hypothetical protein